jgi:hypothetical protein
MHGPQGAAETPPRFGVRLDRKLKPFKGLGDWRPTVLCQGGIEGR